MHANTIRSSSPRSLSAALWVFVILVLSGDAQTFPPPDGAAQHGYTLIGYVGQAPERVKVADQIDVSGPQGRRRTLMITGYDKPGEVPPFDGRISRTPGRNFTLFGEDALKRRLLDAPDGARFRGAFVVYDGSPGALLVTSLDDSETTEH